MEKRKLEVSYDHSNERDKGKMNTYTFIIPGSNFKDIHISVKNDKKKKEKKK